MAVIFENVLCDDRATLELKSCMFERLF